MSWWVKQQIHTPMHLLSLDLVQIWQGKFQDNSNIILLHQCLHLGHSLSLLITLTLPTKLPLLNEHFQAQGKVRYPFHKNQLSRSRTGPRTGQHPGPDGSLALEDHRRLERGSTPGVLLACAAVDLATLVDY